MASPENCPIVQKRGSSWGFREPSKKTKMVHEQFEILAWYLAVCMIWCTRCEAVSLLHPKPDPADAAATARWLASENIWGVLSTISSELGGAPFGNVVSFSDGLPGEGHGIPFFYLTTLDPTARNALKDARSSFTISEFPLGTCGQRDPENPACSKLTLTGQLVLLDPMSRDAEFARKALFTKHSEMKMWPADHNFQVFTLAIEDLFLIDWFGGPKPLSLVDYLNLTVAQIPALSNL